MSRLQLNKINKLSFGSTVCRALCLLIIVVMLVAWTFSGVYAKYVTSESSSSTANVAGIGVEIFKLVEHGKAVEEFDYSNVVPGVDIPGPHIQLKIKSEVSYTLYLDVTTRNLPLYINVDGEQVQVVYFDMTSDWELVNTVTTDNYTTNTYKYVVDATDNANNYVFKAGEEHSYLGDKEITVLKNDVIYVSEKYGTIYGKGEDVSFSIKFNAYIKQVL